MEWYNIGTGGNEFLVSKERQESDSVLECWNQWGMNAPENLWLSDNKYFATTESKPNGESNKLMVKNSLYGRDHQSSSSGVCEVGSDSKALVHRPAMLCPDQQLDNLEGINEMDDFYLSSLLDDLPMAEDTHGSKYLKSDAFSTSIDWECKDVGSSQFVPFQTGTNDSPPLKSPVDNDSVQSRDNELMGDETSMEQSLLSDLETVMLQMTEKTRLCFRDALYRLAKCSKQFTLIQSQPDDTVLDRPTEPTASAETLRSETTETSEPKTNTIDRAIANLMFNKMQLNSQDLPTISMSSEPSPTSTNQPCNYTSYQFKSRRFFQSDQFPPGAREVPIYSQQLSS